MIDLTALRKACELATPGKWFARNRFLSLVANNSGMGATLHTNHIGVMAEREDAAFIAAARSAVPALLDRVEELEAGLRDALAIAHAGWGNVDDYFRDKYLDPERLAAIAALVTK